MYEMNHAGRTSETERQKSVLAQRCIPAKDGGRSVKHSRRIEFSSKLQEPIGFLNVISESRICLILRPCANGKEEKCVTNLALSRK